MTALIIYPLITTVLYYLGYQAVITKWLWSRYPAWLNRWAGCPACSGFWYGGLVALGGGWGLGLPFLALPARAWSTVLVVALCSAFWTAVLAWLHLTALRNTLPADDDTA